MIACPGIGYSLDDLVHRANDSEDPYGIHCEYETPVHGRQRPLGARFVDLDDAPAGDLAVDRAGVFASEPLVNV